MDKTTFAGACDMKMLIIEDDVNKIKQLREFVENNYKQIDISEAMSYQSGMESVLELQHDIILLDMSLPTYDVTKHEKGGRPRSFGGRDILREIKRRKILSKAIIVTQFEDFKDEKESKDLKTLKYQLSREFCENYIGAVFYQPSAIEWQSELKSLLQKYVS